MKPVSEKGTKETSSNTIFRDAGDEEAMEAFPVDTPASGAAVDLAETQSLMFGALLEPLAGRSRAQTELAESAETLSPAFRETAARLIRGGPNLSALEGLELYHRQYWFRLLDSLAEDFPETHRFLGNERFWRILESYLIARPSRSYTLRHLGRAMAEHVAGHPEVSAEERPWATAIAGLEYALMEAAEAAGLPKPEPEDFLHSRLVLQPHVRLIETDVPVMRWIPDEDSDWHSINPEPSCAVVWRGDDGDCQYDAEDFAALPLLRSFQQPGTLEEVLARVDFTGLPDPSALQGWFARWQARGWFGLLDPQPA